MDDKFAFGLEGKGSSAGKESACNAGDPGSIPGLGDPLEEGMVTHSWILAWRVPMDRGAWRATVHGVTKSQTRLTKHTTTQEGEIKVHCLKGRCVHVWREEIWDDISICLCVLWPSSNKDYMID